MRGVISSSSTISILLAGLGLTGDASAATGGPDAFGYYFYDQVSGAVYSYINIAPTGTNIGSGDDTLFAAVNLGASFTFYGNVVNQVRPSSNGFITSTAGTSSDFSNDCPIPLVAGGGGFRINPLHDDLISTVYYQFFDVVGAAAMGYPGETAGISVFQWVGEYYPVDGGDAINVEVILFHDDNTILTMVSQDTNAGLGATLGIQNNNATAGLNYTCNTAGSTVPGATAVVYTLNPPTPPPDSDCCTASPTDTPGCTDPACETTVCAIDAYCCDTSWDDTCVNEAIMLCGALCGSCGDGVAGPGEECDTGGESATCDADCTVAACGDLTVNAVAGEICDDGGESVTCDIDCTAAACGDGVVNATADEICDDGGRSPACNADCTAVSCGDGMVNAAAGEECDDGGESITCDADCTAVSCGDGVVNGSADEACDDGGESATCDDDCTEASCGDGVINASAGEECDDANTNAGDGCASDCIVEPEPGTTGGSESTGGSMTTSGLDTGTDESNSSASADTGEDDTVGTGGGTGATTSAGPGPGSLSTGNDSTGGETGTDDSGVEVPDEGCNCSTAGNRRTGWLWLALFGLGALRRRRP
jgi:MYXO-CTERM domain-containing protein